MSLRDRIEASLNRCDLGLACLPILFDPALQCSPFGTQDGQLRFAVGDLLRQPLADNLSLVQAGAKVARYRQSVVSFFGQAAIILLQIPRNGVGEPELPRTPRRSALSSPAWLLESSSHSA